MQSGRNFKAPIFNRKLIQLNADQYRDMLWPEDTIPIDLRTILRDRFPLRVEPTKDLFSLADTEAYIRFDMRGIKIDEDRFMDERLENRTRFSIAHEFGHFVLHTPSIQMFRWASEVDWLEFQTNVPDREIHWMEAHANEFAGRFLVPRHHLKRVLSEYGITKQFLTDSCSDGNGVGMVQEVLADLIAPEFEVSSEVMNIRFEREGSLLNLVDD